METININIMDKAGDEIFWHPEGARQEYSHHMYRNSPYETCNTCGNCDGANCDICHLVTIPAHLEFLIASDTMYEWLLEKGAPEDVAIGMAYGDSCKYYSYKGYHLAWPTENMLKEQYPELYARIMTPDQDVLAVINSYKGKFRVFAELSDAVLEYYNPESRYHGHIPNQLELYWVSCNYNHKVACG